MMSYSWVFKWHKRFKGECKDVETIPGMKVLQQVGLRPTLSAWGKGCMVIDDWLTDHKWTEHEPQQWLEDYYRRFGRADDLHEDGVEADKWWPEGMQLCQDILQHLETKVLLGRIIISDGSWIFVYNPETKCQSLQWKRLESPKPKKAWQSKSKVKSHKVLAIGPDDPPACLQRYPVAFALFSVQKEAKVVSGQLVAASQCSEHLTVSYREHHSAGAISLLTWPSSLWFFSISSKSRWSRGPVFRTWKPSRGRWWQSCR